MTTNVTEENSNSMFYTNAIDYWSKIPATVDGMLGGFGFISRTDIQGSRIFLRKLFQLQKPPYRQCALDCGAGIGRITKHLLVNFFDCVDLVEQNPIFLNQAKEYIGGKLLSKVGQFYNSGLQNFEPQKSKYDVIWVQWVLGHLTDNDLHHFLISCKSGLTANGLIVIKENVTSSAEIEIDEQDSSMTRPLHLLEKLFEKAHLDCHL